MIRCRLRHLDIALAPTGRCNTARIVVAVVLWNRHSV